MTPEATAAPASAPAFKLTARQAELNQLLASPTTHILAWGGSRSGKTFTVVRAIETPPYLRANAGPQRHACANRPCAGGRHRRRGVLARYRQHAGR